MFKRNKNKIEEKILNEMLIDNEYQHLIDVACSLTIGKKVNVRFGGTESYTDGKSIQVGLFDFIRHYEEDIILYCLTAAALHEAQHIVSTNFNFLEMINPKYKNNKKAKALIQNLFNAIEDGRIERIHMDKYKTNIKYIKTMRMVWYQEQPCSELTDDEVCEIENKIYEEYSEELKNMTSSNIDKFVEDKLTERIEIIERKNLVSNLFFWVCTIATMKKAPLNFESIYNDDILVNRFCNTFRDKIIDCVKDGSCEDIIKLSEEIFEYLDIRYDIDEEIVQETMNKIIILAEEIVENPGSDFIKEDLSMVNIDKEIKKIIEDKKVNIVNLPVPKNMQGANIKEEDFKSKKCPYITEINNLKNQIKQIMDIIYHDEIRGLRSGRIITKELWKTALNKTNIMYKPKIELKKDIALYLLIDSSASMRSEIQVNNSIISKMQLANRTGAVLESSFCEYVNLEIAYFSREHIIVRKFDEESNDSFVWARQIEARGANRDYENLEYAINILKKREEVKKFIFIISDGMPCPSSQEKSAEELVREQVNLAKKQGITTIAFTVETDPEEYESMYDNIIGCSSYDLQTKLLNMMKRILL